MGQYSHTAPEQPPEAKIKAADEIPNARDLTPARFDEWKRELARRAKRGRR
jgi:hypothetical protein